MRQGDVLASIESDDLVNAVSQAQATQRAAQLKLDDLLGSSTAADIAAADQALISPQSNLTKARMITTRWWAVAVQPMSLPLSRVSAAQAQLDSARSARAKLDDTPSDADRAAAKQAWPRRNPP